jgi:hypothetical protein
VLERKTVVAPEDPGSRRQGRIPTVAVTDEAISDAGRRMLVDEGVTEQQREATAAAIREKRRTDRQPD